MWCSSLPQVWRTQPLRIETRLIKFGAGVCRASWRSNVVEAETLEMSKRWIFDCELYVVWRFRCLVMELKENCKALFYESVGSWAPRLLIYLRLCLRLKDALLTLYVLDSPKSIHLPFWKRLFVCSRGQTDELGLCPIVAICNANEPIMESTGFTGFCTAIASTKSVRQFLCTFLNTEKFNGMK